MQGVINLRARPVVWCSSCVKRVCPSVVAGSTEFVKRVMNAVYSLGLPSKLKLMKFYYNLSYNLLPSYFNYYLEVINNAFPCQYELRQIARPLIRPQRTRLVFTELNVLFQLIQLLNYTHIHYP